MKEENFEKIDKNDKPKKEVSKATVGGILLIMSGIIALLLWFSIFAFNTSILESAMENTQFQQLDQNITVQQITEVLNLCSIIGCILAVFPILGGIVTLRRKMWGLAVAGGIIGIFTIGPLFLSSILSLIGVILIGISKKEFIK